MSRSRYAVLGTVVIAAVVVAALLPHGSLIQTLASVPIFASLTAVAVDILREQAKRQHESTLAEDERRFALAAGSHMASTAFDRHVAFCEEYVAELQAALRTLFREGPTKDALTHSDTLYGIKRKYAIWITAELEAQLEPFERALRKIGAADFVSRQFPGSNGHAERTRDMYRCFAEVLGTEHMGKEWEGEPISDTAAVSRVVSHLRTVLGVEELTKLRNVIIKRALEANVR